MRLRELTVALTLGLALVPSVSAALSLEGVVIHGFVSQSWLKSTDNNYLTVDTEEGSFEFTEGGVNFAAEPVESLRIGLQLFARNVGDMGNNGVALDWALGDYRWRDWLGVRAGKVKLPVGLYNDTRDADMARAEILLPQSIYPERLRDLLSSFDGFELYGTLPLGAAGEMEYQVYGGTMNLDDTFAMDRLAREGALSGLDSLPLPLEGAGFTVGDIEADMEYTCGFALRWNAPLDSLRFGVTYNTARADITNTTVYSGYAGGVPVAVPLQVATDFRQDYNVVGSAEYRRGGLLLSAEYFQQQTAVSTTLGGAPFLPPGARDSEEVAESWYVRASYRFNRRLELGGYYEEFYPDRDDRQGARFTAMGRPDYLAWLKDAALFARFDVTPFWLVKAEVNFYDGAARVGTLENPGGLERDWTLFALRTTFYF